MFTVYLIQLPVNFSPRVLAFQNQKKAEEVCEALNHELGYFDSATAPPPLKVLEMTVLEDHDVKVISEGVSRFTQSTNTLQ